MEKLSADQIKFHIKKIDDWLLSSPVLCPVSGAVAGITEEDKVVYWYGEIAGYYLSYLATLCKQSRRYRLKAGIITTRVIEWLRRQWSDGPPPTRIHVDFNGGQDWRNHFVFAFDLAMILRGIASVRSAELAVWDGESIRKWLISNMADKSEGVRPVLPQNDTAPEMYRWSTTMDGYQLKTAMALQYSADIFGDIELFKMANSIQKHLLANQHRTEKWMHLPAHPRLYAWEGMLGLGIDRCEYYDLGQLLPNYMTTSHTDRQRVDVIAQWLRLMCCCHPDHPLIDLLAESLLSAIDDNGSVRFRTSDMGNERNTWCAIFSRQALNFYHRIRSGRIVYATECI